MHRKADKKQPTVEWVTEYAVMCAGCKCFLGKGGKSIPISRTKVTMLTEEHGVLTVTEIAPVNDRDVAYFKSTEGAGKASLRAGWRITNSGPDNPSGPDNQVEHWCPECTAVKGSNVPDPR